MTAKRFMQIVPESGMAKLHRCDSCGTVDAWTKDWQWYGSYNDMELGKVVVTCSQTCRDGERTKTLIDNMPRVDNRQRAY